MQSQPTTALNHATQPYPWYSPLAKLIHDRQSTLLLVPRIKHRCLSSTFFRITPRPLHLTPGQPSTITICHHRLGAVQNFHPACENRLPVNHNLDTLLTLQCVCAPDSLLVSRCLPRHSRRALRLPPPLHAADCRPQTTNCHLPSAVKYRLACLHSLHSQPRASPHPSAGRAPNINSHRQIWLTKSQSPSVVTAVVVNLQSLCVSSDRNGLQSMFPPPLNKRC